MISGACRDAEQLMLLRSSGQLSEADGLRLEQHVSGCVSCRDDVVLGQVVRDTLRRSGRELSDTARVRTISRAFEAASEPPRHTVRAAPIKLAAWGAGFAVAAAALFAVVRLQGNDAAQQAAQGSTLAATKTHAVDQAAKATVSEDWFETKTPEDRTFAHARVHLAAGSRARFHAANASLELERGRLELDVDPTPARRFQVLTQNFRVEVLGTQFSVEPSSVEVFRGRVAVYGRDGSPLVSELKAGHSYQYAPTKHVASRAVSAAPHRQVAVQSLQPKSSEVLSSAAWLERARAALSTQDTASARELVAHAEQANPRTVDRAEAGTLRAQAAMLDGDLNGAINLYVGVANKYGDLPAGENAAYAAAQLARRSRSSQEKALFERYLQRYPQGRFAKEARLHLTTP
jgi:ferric-dicitrate binding protein FerR (iron transport regulator)